MSNKLPIVQFSSPKVTKTVILGSLFIAASLGIILIIYDIAHGSFLRMRFWVVLSIIVYLCIALYFSRTNKLRIANWMLVILFELIALLNLLLWGLNSSLAILTTSFVILLPGLLMGSRYILPVAVITLLMLVIVQTVHILGFITPDLASLSEQSTYWDVLVFVIVLTIFALIARLSGDQLEQSLRRSQRAETALRKQKQRISQELAKQSARLRQEQLKQTRQLHKFAILGQSAAATLHELSNLLSILNLDIDDIKHESSKSAAISSAESTIKNVNSIVKQARQQINTYDNNQKINIILTTRQLVNDLHEKYERHGANLTMVVSGSESLHTKGDPYALMQILTILLNNALEASSKMISSKTTVTISKKNREALISITDNGPGINNENAELLFTPHKSSKSTGLGVGLYIAQHLAKNQLNGFITLDESKVGAKFTIHIPIKKIS